MPTSTIDFVAWWGAIVATGVLTWDIYKVRSAKPTLLLRTTTVVYPDNVLNLEIANVGSKVTTLTRVYANAGDGAESEDGSKIVIPTGGARTSSGFENRFALPYTLSPGSVWNGWINPSYIYRIQDLSTMIVKVRDEHGKLVVRREVEVPSQWRRSNN